MFSKMIISFAAIAIAISSASAIQRPINSLQAPLGRFAAPSASRSPAASATSATNSFSSDSIRHFEQTVNEDGSFKYAYETDAGTKVAEQGEQKINGDVQANTVSGSYEYVAPDGSQVKLTYVADENGFRPTGDHLPVPPAVPEAIQRALRYIQSHPAASQ